MKKFFILCAALIVVSACSSTEKKDMSEPAMKDAKATMDTKKEEMKNTADQKMADANSQASKASCSLDKDTRVIEVKKTEAGGCELFYTKFGEAKSVASSGFGTQYCEEVKDRIQSNLNKAGFSCQ